MNFFEHQEVARKNTTLLLFLFAVSVIFTICALYVAIVILLMTAGPEITVNGQSIYRLWSPLLFGVVALGTLAVVGGGTTWRISTLRGGGGVVAQELGGQLVALNSDDPEEQKLLNVVAEMAIASGIPVPDVYILNHEPGINAFAAGFSTDDAAIGVTRGCVEQLSRDELQGVIAHEFSHILNGDMRLNLRLIGVLHGILLIYLIGRGLLRIVFDTGVRVRSSDDKKGNAVLVVVAAGFAFVVIGSIGFFCGRAIKSAVSRQREFLADASAVQFTRNPLGIGGALRKIGGYARGSDLLTGKAEEHSHLFFGSALDSWFFPGLLATHPPLEARIGRIEGLKVAARRSQRSAAATPLTATGAMGFAGGAAAANEPSQAARSPQPQQLQVKPGSVITAVGTTDPEHLAYARALLAKLPEELRQAVRDRASAAAIIYGSLLDRQAEIRNQQLILLKQADGVEIAEASLRYGALVAQLDPRLKLPLVDLTIPALRQSSSAQIEQFFQQVKQLATADGKVSFSEYILQIVLQRRLQPHFSQKEGRSQVQHTAIGAIWDDCTVVLTALAKVGHTSQQNITYAFRSGMFRLPGASKRGVPPEPPACNLRDVSRSLARLERAAPKLKQAVVDACAHTVLVDHHVTVREAELLRAIAIALGCPLPPFLETA
ncbi:MAG: M48 family metalloprotease [Spirulinaceae cyanobacterium SM2_1_0]|nr:M48 family metalloprotease [Spirulinaceae cyanobacterium SM2_1_0]